MTSFVFKKVAKCRKGSKKHKINYSNQACLPAMPCLPPTLKKRDPNRQLDSLGVRVGWLEVTTKSWFQEILPCPLSCLAFRQRCSQAPCSTGASRNTGRQDGYTADPQKLTRYINGSGRKGHHEQWKVERRVTQDDHGATKSRNAIDYTSYAVPNFPTPLAEWYTKEKFSFTLDYAYIYVGRYICIYV